MERKEWQEVKEKLLKERTSIPNLLILLFDLSLIIPSILLSPLVHARNFFSHSMSIFLLTVALVHIYLLKHEATHSALFKNKKINNLFGQFFGWLIFLPFLSRQRSHLLHHTWTGHPIGDPSNERMIRRFTVMTVSEEKRLEKIWKLWIPMLAINDRIGLWIDPFSKRHSSRSQVFLNKERRAAAFYAIGYIAVLLILVHLKFMTSFALWYFPAIILLFITEELINLPHHAETPLLNKEDRALPFWKQESVTHSCSTIPVWSNFFLLNFNLHTAHHYFPMLPWNLLPLANQSVLKNSSNPLVNTPVSSEIAWSLSHRRRPLLSIMGHYFDRIERDAYSHLKNTQIQPDAPDLFISHPNSNSEAIDKTL